MTMRARGHTVVGSARGPRPRRLAASAALMIGLLTAAAGCIPRTPLDQSRAWELHGVVVAAGGGTLSVRHKSGRVVALVVDDRTVYSQRDGPGRAPALRPGARVRVQVETRAGIDYARQVHVSAAGRL